MKTPALAVVMLAALAAISRPALGGPPEPEPFELAAHAGSLVDRITGTFTDGAHTLRLAATPCGGHDLCLYVELSERGGERRPMRQMVWTLDGATDAGADATVYLFPPRRLDTFVMSPADAAVGLWAAPLRFPVLDLDSLLPAGRARLEVSADGWRLSAPEPLVVHRGEARELALEVAETDGALSWSDAWRAGGGEAADGLVATLRRVEEPARVEVTPEGLVIIDLREGQGPPLERGDAALINYAVYLFSGQIVDSTWLDSRKEEMMFSAPGEKFLGFQMGVLGMRAPSTAPAEAGRHLRRLVVPPALAFGAEGRRPIIDANDPLIVDIELITVKKKKSRSR